MPTLNISISETEYKKFGLKGDTLSFSEFIALVRNEIYKQTIVEDVTFAEMYGQSTLKADETGSRVKKSYAQKRLAFSDFSFAKSRKALEDYKGSFSDSVVEERRAEL